jgi:hypothetical protein
MLPNGNIPARMETDTSVTQSTKNSYTPAEIKKMQDEQNKAVSAQNQAITDRAEADSKLAEVQKNSYDALAKKQEEDAKAKAIRESDFQKKSQDELTALQKTTNDLSSAKIDPNRLWNNSSTGNKILAGVAFALGALGASKDGVNRAVEVWDNAIARDIAVQKANLDNKFKSVEARSSLLGQMTQLFGDAEKGRLATEMTMYKSIENKMHSSLAGVKMSAESKANASESLAKVQQHLADLQTDFVKLQHKEVVTSTTANSKLVTPDVKVEMDKDKFVLEQKDKAFKAYGVDEKRDSVVKLDQINQQIQAGSSFAKNSVQYEMVKAIVKQQVSDAELSGMGLSRGAYESAKASLSKWAGGPMTKDQQNSINLMLAASKRAYQQSVAKAMKDTMPVLQKYGRDPQVIFGAQTINEVVNGTKQAQAMDSVISKTKPVK